MITGKLEPCSQCDARRKALNVLFPIPVWKMFFKCAGEYQRQLDKEYKEFGVMFNPEDVKKEPSKKQPVTKTIVMTMDDMIKNK
jgi:hypothetical protein